MRSCASLLSFCIGNNTFLKKKKKMFLIRRNKHRNKIFTIWNLEPALWWFLLSFCVCLIHSHSHESCDIYQWWCSGGDLVQLKCHWLLHGLFGTNTAVLFCCFFWDHSQADEVCAVITAKYSYVILINSQSQGSACCNHVQLEYLTQILW